MPAGTQSKCMHQRLPDLEEDPADGTIETVPQDVQCQVVAQVRDTGCLPYRKTFTYHKPSYCNSRLSALSCLPRTLKV